MHDANVAATRHLLRLARDQDECCTFVLTSSMACVTNYNTVVAAKEECTPYTAHPTNGCVEPRGQNEGDGKVRVEA